MHGVAHACTGPCTRCHVGVYSNATASHMRRHSSSPGVRREPQFPGPARGLVAAARHAGPGNRFPAKAPITASGSTFHRDQPSESQAVAGPGPARRPGEAAALCRGEKPSGPPFGTLIASINVQRTGTWVSPRRREAAAAPRRIGSATRRAGGRRAARAGAPGGRQPLLGIGRLRGHGPGRRRPGERCPFDGTRVPRPAPPSRRSVPPRRFGPRGRDRSCRPKMAALIGAAAIALAAANPDLRLRFLPTFSRGGAGPGRVAASHVVQMPAIARLPARMNAWIPPHILTAPGHWHWQ